MLLLRMVSLECKVWHLLNELLEKVVCEVDSLLVVVADVEINLDRLASGGGGSTFPHRTRHKLDFSFNLLSPEYERGFGQRNQHRLLLHLLHLLEQLALLATGEGQSKQNHREDEDGSNLLIWQHVMRSVLTIINYITTYHF
jgi:hypothetical protein